MLVYDEKVPRHFWRIAIVAGVLLIKGAILRIAETNEILKRPENKLFSIEYTYHNNNQTDKAREPNLRWETAVIRELKRKYECSLPSFHWKYFPVLPEF